MNENVFQGCRIYILPNGILPKRAILFKEQILKHGGSVVSDKFCSNPTHIVVEDEFLMNPAAVKAVLNYNNLKLEDIQCDIVSTLWLSKCLKEKKLLSTRNFCFKNFRNIHNNETSTKIEPQNKIRKLKESEVSLKFRYYCNITHFPEVAILIYNTIILDKLRQQKSCLKF